MYFFLKVYSIFTLIIQGKPSLLMTDTPCLPGCEGGAVYDYDSNFVGVRVFLVLDI
jgi:hypothetical protein